tara:strand:- start:517 stop:765 length:249 start_codon:yes stop_codon:yes gene_type:complete
VCAESEYDDGFARLEISSLSNARAENRHANIIAHCAAIIIVTAGIAALTINRFGRDRGRHRRIRHRVYGKHGKRGDNKDTGD